MKTYKSLKYQHTFHQGTALELDVALFALKRNLYKLMGIPYEKRTLEAEIMLFLAIGIMLTESQAERLNQ